MRKLFLGILMLFSTFCFARNVNFHLKEVSLYSDKIEDLEYRLTVEIENPSNYYGDTKLSVNFRPFDEMPIFHNSSDIDYSSGLELEVKEDFNMNFNEKNKKYYTAKIIKDFDVLLEKKFTFIVGPRGISVVDGHPIY